MKKYLILFLLLLNSISCDESTVDCSTVLCIGPPSIAIEIIQNNTNVLEETIYTLDDIGLTGDNVETFELTIAEREFLDESNEVSTKTILFISNRDWQTRRYDLNLSLASDFSIPLSTEIGLSQGDCCGGIPLLASLEINGETIAENEIYGVHLVELN